jgi:hypothetical protein
MSIYSEMQSKTQHQCFFQEFWKRGKKTAFSEKSKKKKGGERGLNE